MATQGRHVISSLNSIGVYVMKYDFELTITIQGTDQLCFAVAMYDYDAPLIGQWAHGIQIEPDVPACVSVYEVYIVPDDATRPFIYIGELLSARQFNILEDEILDLHREA